MHVHVKFFINCDSFMQADIRILYIRRRQVPVVLPQVGILNIKFNHYNYSIIEAPWLNNYM